MKEQIIKILTEARPEFDFTQENSEFIDNGMLDSFDIITVVSDLEIEFKISISAENIIPENFNSIQSIENLLKKLQGMI